MGIRQWWQALKKEKKRKELIRAAQKLENKVDPSIPKKTLPQKSCGKIGNNWSGKEEGTGKIREVLSIS